MEWIPLFIVIAFLGVLGFIVYRVILAPIRQGEEMTLKAKEHKERYAKAVWAGATVVTVDKPKMDRYGMRQLKVRLRLEVETQGGETYPAKTTWLVEESVMPQMVPGARVSVRVDAEDPALIYPNMNGIEYWVG